MENNQSSHAEVESMGAGASSPVNASIIIWGVLSLILAILVCTVSTAPAILAAGFFGKLFAVVVGSALGLLGAVIGDALRKVAAPDSVYTTGGFFQLIWIKVFWKIGPQVIGLFIGVIAGTTLVLH